MIDANGYCHRLRPSFEYTRSRTKRRFLSVVAFFPMSKVRQHQYAQSTRHFSDQFTTSASQTINYVLQNKKVILFRKSSAMTCPLAVSYHDAAANNAGSAA